MSAIKAGDFVEVVKAKACCGWGGNVGSRAVIVATCVIEFLQCQHCGRITQDIACAQSPNLLARGEWIDVRRLRKIPPPPLTEDTPTTEELTA